MPARELQFSSLGFPPQQPERLSSELIASAFGQSPFNSDSLEHQLMLLPLDCFSGCPVFKLKCNEHGNPSYFKARYICCSFSAVYNQDYTKTTSSTACMESFCVLAHLSAALDWEIKQLDIKMAFLNGVLDPNEICYMDQPEGFVEPGFEDCI